MKLSVKELPSFTPITLTILIESTDELAALLELSGSTHSVAKASVENKVFNTYDSYPVIVGMLTQIYDEVRRYGHNL